jgi:hypothetical protein
VAGILENIEKKLGLPPLEDISKVLQKIPDERRLKLLKQVLDSAYKVKGSEEELAVVAKLVDVIAGVPTEKLVVLRDILKELNKLSRALPKEALSQLPLSDLLSRLKQ